MGASAEGANFALQVSPSPLVTTLKPGETKTLELKIRNASTADEHLKIEARTFSFDNETGTVSLNDTLAPAIARWLTLPEPGFLVQPGEWRTIPVTISLPQDVGFSYSFSLIISRNDSSAVVESGRLLKGSIAVFTLINIDRPGAVRKLELTSFKSDAGVYEYLPASITVRLKNTGNTIVQPYGNVFIQRASTDSTPIATLPVNDTQSYLLPGSERSLETIWADGFPVYTATDDHGSGKRSLQWNVDAIRHFRIGKYTAKLVAAYNDGTRDVPIVGEVTFWVIPWKSLAAMLTVIVGLILIAKYYLRVRTEKAVQKALNKQKNE